MTSLVLCSYLNNQSQERKKTLVWLMVFNATFNNMSVISWWSALLVEETRVPRENHWPAASHWQTLSHNVVSRTPSLRGVRTHKNISHVSVFYFFLLHHRLCWGNVLKNVRYLKKKHKENNNHYFKWLEYNLK